MYEAFYGLSEKPFLMRPDTRYLFLSKGHQAALSMLEYVFMSQSGFAVITGEIGSGKTSLVRRLMKSDRGSLTIGLLSHTMPENFSELLQWMLLAFEQDPSGDNRVLLYQRLCNYLGEQQAAGNRPVLVIDEAHNLSVEMLEHLRMLSNLNADRADLLQLVLVGQAGLRETLSDPACVPFRHRITVDHNIEPLDLEEAHAYIRHRLMVAGVEHEIFSDAAVQTIWEASRGIPRLVNLLCDTALLFGFAEQLTHIDSDLAHDVIDDKRQSLSPV